MSKIKVLFACIHNSARSQMADELLKKIGGEKFEVESAGFEPGTINPYVAKVLLEDDGIDISQKKTNSIFDLFKEGRLYDYVITVCDESTAEQCPIFPGMAKRIHWSFSDPSGFQGSDEEKMAGIRVVKSEIQEQIENWLKTI